MRVAVRVDASLRIGTGHVMRCLALAGELRRRGAVCRFLCRDEPGHLLAEIAAHGFAVQAVEGAAEARGNAGNAGRGDTSSPLPAHAGWLGTSWEADAAATRGLLGDDRIDWLVADHYALDFRWERAVRPCAARLMVIDDLADRAHDCDFLLDQNLGRSAAAYAGLTPPGTLRLIGPAHALLRPEFARTRAASLARRSHPVLERLLVTLGGVDRDNATGAVLDALDGGDLPPGLGITVVLGSHAPWLEAVRERARRMRVPVEVLCGVRDMAALMAACDLAIGGAGSTSWERCCLGLPTVQLVLAANQAEAAQALADAGAAVTIPADSGLRPALQAILDGFVSEPERLAKMASRAAAICDGMGTRRVADAMGC